MSLEILFINEIITSTTLVLGFIEHFHTTLSFRCRSCMSLHMPDTKRYIYFPILQKSLDTQRLRRFKFVGFKVVVLALCFTIGLY